MAKVVKKKVSWTGSVATDVVGYKVYWSKEANGTPDYSSANATVNGNQVIIPDVTSSFPVADEINYILGISAIDDVGN